MLGKIGERDWQRDWELCQKATPGPWEFHNPGRERFEAEVRQGLPWPYRIEYRSPTGAVVADRWGIAKITPPSEKYYNRYQDPEGTVWKKAVEQYNYDGRFIAMAREALPYWLQKVKELEEENKMLKAKLEEVQK